MNQRHIFLFKFSWYGWLVQIVRNILSLIFVEFGLFWMFWLYLSYYEGIGMRQLGLPPKNAPNCVVMESKSEEEESGGVSPPHHSVTWLWSRVKYSHYTAWRLLHSPSSRSKKLSKFNRAKMPIIMIIRFMRYLHQTVGPSQTYQKPVFNCYILLFLLWCMNSAFKCILSHAKIITELF